MEYGSDRVLQAAQIVIIPLVRRIIDIPKLKDTAFDSIPFMAGLSLEASMTEDHAISSSSRSKPFNERVTTRTDLF